MTANLTRRRFLAISAAALSLPAAAEGAGAYWQGTALGAPASMRLEGVAPEAARPVFRDMAAELARLEHIFSLHRDDSALVRLNRSGRLDDPPADLLEVLGISEALHAATGGAFDPTVQALWRTHAEASFTGGTADPARLARARDATGWQHVRFDAAAVHLERPGMELTLNGIAQGFVTDRISDLLASRGFGNTLVDMGEVRARGRKVDGRTWVAGVAGADGTILSRVTLSDRALATSASLGTVLDPKGQVGHIIDPASGLPGASHRLVSVSARTAVLADGLSTACCLLAPATISRAVGSFPGAALETLV